MSFPKAKTKRFNDVNNAAPGPGAYDPNLHEKVKGCAPIHDGRFKTPKDVIPGPGAFDSSTCSIGTPAKKLFGGLGSSKKSFSVQDLSKQRDLEREIKKLLKERATQDKTLANKEEEITRLDGKLQAAYKDRSGLQAQVAVLEKELKEVNKGNEILKAKVNASDSSNKRQHTLKDELTSLHVQLSKKDQEVADLQNDLDVMTKTMQADLEASRANVAALEERNRALEQSNEEIMAHSEEIEEQVTQLHIVSDKLRAENLSLQQQLAQACLGIQELQREVETVVADSKRKIQDLSLQLERERALAHRLTLTQENLNSKEQCNEKLQEYRDSLLDKIEYLESKTRQLQVQKMEDEEIIRSLKGEVFVNEDYLKQEEESLNDAAAELKSLRKEVADLKASEALLNHNIRAITDKYQLLEKDLETVDKESARTESTLRAELATTKAHLEHVKEERETYKKNNMDALRQFHHEQEEKEQSQQELQSLEKKHEALQKEMEELQAVHCNLESTMKNQAATLESLTQEKMKLEDAVVSMKKELTSAIEEHNAESRQLQENLTEKYLSIAQLEEDLQKHKTLASELELAKVELEAKLVEAYGELETIIDQNESEEHDLQEEITRCKSRIQHLELDHTSRAAEASDLKGKCADLADLVDSLKTGNRTLKDTCAGLEEELVQSKALVAEMEGKVRQCEEEIVLARKEVQDKTTEEKQLEEKIQEKEGLVERLKTDVKRKQEKIDSLLEMNEKMANKLGEQSKAAAQRNKLQEELESVKSQYEGKVASLQSELEQSRAECEAANVRCDEVAEELKTQYSSLEERSSKTQEEYSRRLVETQKRLSMMHTEFCKFKADREEKISKLEETILNQRTEFSAQMEELRSEMQNDQQSDHTEELTYWTEEAHRWQVKFEELQKKVLPFQEQLDMYEAERQALQGQNKDAFQEIDKLGKEYARLLGHQNQKQKIRHVVKMKEENTHLKQEIGKLREEKLKHQKTVQRLEERLAAVEGKKRFDPSKAFSHAKENQMPARTPLKEGNKR
ncbi:hyaluronan mediated motility receptor [Lingula anatina]|uniref:Hyaluronan mediated motility receptor n=1 Tax=Lingula anatina TaxID=7574 RepID=A0A1S3I0C2_LINAN|nr:hyaluronan mediated motility receptor [Lingula anatina]|eukprot:XP_013391271.1 hyaluronan mediated motility receptor [Lingula anatina]